MCLEVEKESSWSREVQSCQLVRAFGRGCQCVPVVPRRRHIAINTESGWRQPCGDAAWQNAAKKGEEIKGIARNSGKVQGKLEGEARTAEIKCPLWMAL